MRVMVDALSGVEQGAVPLSFGVRRPGPELALEDAVVNNLGSLSQGGTQPSCVFGSKPIGAGAPDLTLLFCEPEVTALAGANGRSSDVLAYLRVVHRARFETVRERLLLGESAMEATMEALLAGGAVVLRGDLLSLTPQWRNVLREVVAVEAKVSHWRKAVRQAARNRAFAHRSMVALPAKQANRASADTTVRGLGIGVLSIDEGGCVRTLRRSRRSSPRVWRYYYDLALEAARLLSVGSDAVRRPDRQCEAAVPQL
jgi:hypothetical protein